MGNRFVQPDSVRLELTDGDWVEVKKELSYGDMKDVASETRGDLASADLNLVAAFLLDWSFRDASDKPVDIDTDGKKLSALRNLTTASFSEISTAIDTHVKAAMEAKKPKAQRGVKRSDRISASAA